MLFLSTTVLKCISSKFTNSNCLNCPGPISQQGNSLKWQGWDTFSGSLDPSRSRSSATWWGRRPSSSLTLEPRLHGAKSPQPALQFVLKHSARENVNLNQWKKDLEFGLREKTEATRAPHHLHASSASSWTPTERNICLLKIVVAQPRKLQLWTVITSMYQLTSHLCDCETISMEAKSKSCSFNMKTMFPFFSVTFNGWYR